MAFGISRSELTAWKEAVARAEIAFLTHYWVDRRFPDMKTVTKVGCSDLGKLAQWCMDNGLNPRYIHRRDEYPHFDLLGPKQREILLKENLLSQLERFQLL
ncbi:hypothetical protein M3194_07550 [Paenibacillus glycanilyticus]|uniref:hypothetical protein n=1 Tax=Paenibacillus glycanilyticus TaxID=126569 RepID=UPI00203D2D56|nr:hypothetical protein [Paenibacillus glycanilyticus]MCM3627216.1 hypothetical protein [Paenibacillus glycanilyticus]